MKPPKFVIEDLDCSLLGGGTPDFLNNSDSFAPGDFRQPKLTHLARRFGGSKKRRRKKLAGQDSNLRKP